MLPVCESIFVPLETRLATDPQMNTAHSHVARTGSETAGNRHGNVECGLTGRLVTPAHIINVQNYEKVHAPKGSHRHDRVHASGRKVAPPIWRVWGNAIAVWARVVVQFHSARGGGVRRPREEPEDEAPLEEDQHNRNVGGEDLMGTKKRERRARRQR